ncbi:MAG: hypothetical protein ABIW36_00390 [Terrimesophilobacter sp.]
MTILRIQHPVPDYERWKVAFDNDPADRVASGVLRYWIRRPVDDPRFVMIDLKFATVPEAEELLRKMQAIWSSGRAPVSATPQAWIVETAEEVELV